MKRIKEYFFKEVFLLKPEVYIDDRGTFSENFVSKILEQNVGKKISFCQDNLTHSKRGVIRGLHYQLPPYSQTKLVSVLKGRVLDIVVDIRKGSPTFGKHISQELSAENQLQLFISRGFAHGFITLSETSIFQYKVDQYYYPESEGSISPNDPHLEIDWKIPEDEWVQSDKDKKHSTLLKASVFNFKDDLYA